MATTATPTSASQLSPAGSVSPYEADHSQTLAAFPFPQTQDVTPTLTPSHSPLPLTAQPKLQHLSVQPGSSGYRNKPASECFSSPVSPAVTFASSGPELTAAPAFSASEVNGTSALTPSDFVTSGENFAVAAEEMMARRCGYELSPRLEGTGQGMVTSTWEGQGSPESLPESLKVETDTKGNIRVETVTDGFARGMVTTAEQAGYQSIESKPFDGVFHEGQSSLGLTTTPPTFDGQFATNEHGRTDMPATWMPTPPRQLNVTDSSPMASTSRMAPSYPPYTTHPGSATPITADSGTWAHQADTYSPPTPAAQYYEHPRRMSYPAHRYNPYFDDDRYTARPASTAGYSPYGQVHYAYPGRRNTFPTMAYASPLPPTPGSPTHSGTTSITATSPAIPTSLIATGGRHSAMSTSPAFLQNRRYPCNVCPKRFSRPSTLKTHMNSHTGNRPFKCEPECGWSFTVMSNLKRHRKVCPAAQRKDALLREAAAKRED